MTKQCIKFLNDDPLPSLREEHAENPGVRYFALGDLLDKPGPGYHPKYRSTRWSHPADLSVEFNLPPTLEKDNHEAIF